MRFFILLVLIVLAGCTLAKVDVEVVSERTALENQILGSYNSLDREMLLAASVRAVDPKGRLQKPAEHSEDHKGAVTAMQALAFHGDDLRNFKELGWVGENMQGLLSVFPLENQGVPAELEEYVKRFSPEEFKAVVSQINEAREIVMNRVIDINENLSRADLEQVRLVFAGLNREKARPGEKIQLEDGSWTVKEGR